MNIDLKGGDLCYLFKTDADQKEKERNRKTHVTIDGGTTHIQITAFIRQLLDDGR